ncbi:MAG TPA: septum site-determining protein Ssd, partial [Mycobacteriales bacterium]|nr:septum site-determining protein Ssd [Mycobacteriales bacterium]
MSGQKPLVAVGDPSLLDEVLRLGAAAGSEVEVVPDVVAARVRWTSAPLVIVGADELGSCVRAGLPRRSRVVVVTAAEPSALVWEQTVALGAEQAVVLPDGEAALIDWFGRAVDPATGRGRILCCIGGRGGAGASVLAAALAVTASRDAPAFLIDLDPCSGGLDLTLGGEDSDGVRWPDLGRTSGRLSVPSLRDALPDLSGA